MQMKMVIGDHYSYRCSTSELRGWSLKLWKWVSWFRESISDKKRKPVWVRGGGECWRLWALKPGQRGCSPFGETRGSYLEGTCHWMTRLWRYFTKWVSSAARDGAVLQEYLGASGVAEGASECRRCRWLSSVSAFPLRQLSGNFTMHLVDDSYLSAHNLPCCAVWFEEFFKVWVVFSFLAVFMEWGRQMILSCLAPTLGNPEASYGPIFHFCFTWESRYSGLLEFVWLASWDQLLYRGVFPGLLRPCDLQ